MRTGLSRAALRWRAHLTRGGRPSMRCARRASQSTTLPLRAGRRCAVCTVRSTSPWRRCVKRTSSAAPTMVAPCWPAASATIRGRCACAPLALLALLAHSVHSARCSPREVLFLSAAHTAHDPRPTCHRSHLPPQPPRALIARRKSSHVFGPRRFSSARAPLLLAQGFWRAIPDLPTARGYLAATFAPDGCLYVGGGCGGPSDGSQPVTTLEVFDPRASKWRTAQPMPHPRSNHAFVVAFAHGVA